MSAKLFIHRETEEDSLNKYLILKARHRRSLWILAKQGSAYGGWTKPPYVLIKQMNTFISDRGCNLQDEPKDLRAGISWQPGHLSIPG